MTHARFFDDPQPIKDLKQHAEAYKKAKEQLFNAKDELLATIKRLHTEKGWEGAGFADLPTVLANAQVLNFLYAAVNNDLQSITYDDIAKAAKDMKRSPKQLALDMLRDGLEDGFISEEKALQKALDLGEEFRRRRERQPKVKDQTE